MFVSKPGWIIGCDFVGTVVTSGANVPTGTSDATTDPHGHPHVGQLRWGFMRGGFAPNKGAFAEYVTTEWDITGVVPSNITALQAASIPIPYATAVTPY